MGSVHFVQQNKSQLTPRFWAEKWFKKRSVAAVSCEKGLRGFLLTPQAAKSHKATCLQICFAPSLPLHMT